MANAFPPNLYDRIDRQIAGWMARNGHLLLRISLGIIFVLFGFLKVIGTSPAADLVAQTVPWLPRTFFVPFLGIWEMAIGIGFFKRAWIRPAIFLLFLQMPGTMLPLFILPDATWAAFPFALTIEGQYIIKNLVLISAAIVIGGTVRRQELKKAQAL